MKYAIPCINPDTKVFYNYLISGFFIIWLPIFNLKEGCMRQFYELVFYTVKIKSSANAPEIMFSNVVFEDNP